MAAAALLLGAGGGLVVAPGPARAASTAGCTDSSGVTVVVDFGSLGGGVQIRCAPGPVDSGFDALTQAGFTYTNTVRFPGLLCRIDGRPTAEQDACVVAPPADSYWAYWSAPSPGGAWTYTPEGAGTHHPAPGSVEGWAFSGGCDRAPGGPPCPVPTTTTTLRPPTTPAPAPAAGGGNPTSTGPTTTRPVAGDEPSSPSSTAGTGVGDDPGSPSTAPPATAAERGASGDQPSAVLAAAGQRRGPSDGGGGSPLGAAAGGLAVLLVGGAGAIAARRRRSGPDAGAPA